MLKQKHFLPIVVVALAHICWGINTPAIKLAVESMPVQLFLVVRYFIIALVLLPFALHYWQPIRRKDLLRQLIVSGFFAASVFLLSVGLTKTSVSHAAILDVLNPMIMVLFAYLFLGDKTTLRSVFGVIVALTGAAVIVSSRQADGGGSAQLTGDVLILLSVVCSVIGTIIFKPLTKRYNPYQMTLIGLSLGIIPMTIYLVASLDTIHLAEVSGRSVFGLFLSAVTMLSANLLFFYALRKRKLSEISFYYYIQPVVAVLIAWLLLNEKLSLPYAVGASLVLVGICLAEAQKAKRRTEISKINYSKTQ